MESLAKEKRTDVVKRFEEEIAALRESEAGNAQLLATLKAEKAKADVRAVLIYYYYSCCSAIH